jgi:hypothetical protein
MHGLKVASFFVCFHVELGIQRKINILFMATLVAEDVTVRSSSIESYIGNIYLLN